METYRVYGCTPLKFSTRKINIFLFVSYVLAAATTVAITTDGWSNIRNEPIVNFMVCTPTPLLYKTVATKTNSHTADYMAQEILRRDEIALARLRVGQSRVTHGHLMSKESPPDCPRCKIRLTYEHLILDCPIYSSFRKFTPSASLIVLLSHNEQSVFEVLEFLKDSQIINKI